MFHTVSELLADCMVLTLDGNSEISAHVRSNLNYLIRYRQLIRSKAVTNRNFFCSEKTYFLYACETCSELPSNISTMLAVERVAARYVVLPRDTDILLTCPWSRRDQLWQSRGPSRISLGHWRDLVSWNSCKRDPVTLSDPMYNQIRDPLYASYFGVFLRSDRYVLYLEHSSRMAIVLIWDLVDIHSGTKSVGGNQGSTLGSRVAHPG